RELRHASDLDFQLKLASAATLEGDAAPADAALERARAASCKRATLSAATRHQWSTFLRRALLVRQFFPLLTCAAGPERSETTGQAHDGQISDTLLNQLGPHTIVLADKAYDADRIRQLIQDHGATPNIPTKSNRRRKPCFSRRLYREHNLIEISCS